MLDDASRFVVALEALHSEREADMLDVLLAALRRHAPDAIYLDNGSTYRGEALRLCCERLGITLIHARPYDAPARGKMERWYAEVGIMRSRRTSWTQFAGWDSA
jgi:transposase InsO family protein